MNDRQARAADMHSGRGRVGDSVRCIATSRLSESFCIMLSNGTNAIVPGRTRTCTNNNDTPIPRTSGVDFMFFRICLPFAWTVAFVVSRPNNEDCKSLIDRLWKKESFSRSSGMEYNLRRLRYYDSSTEILTLVHENTYTDYLHRYEWALRYDVMLKKQTSEYIM